jgi:hypothetical protein
VQANGTDPDTDPTRFRKLALATLKTLVRPTEAMLDAAHEAVWSGACWAMTQAAMNGRAMD